VGMPTRLHTPSNRNVSPRGQNCPHTDVKKGTPTAGTLFATAVLPYIVPLCCLALFDLLNIVDSAVRIADLDLARLECLGHFAHQVDGQHAIVE